MTTGCFGHRDPWLQPASTSRRQPFICSSTDETFLSQLWFPTTTTVFHPSATASIFFRCAFLHSGPQGKPQLLQYTHDTAEWRGGMIKMVHFINKKYDWLTSPYNIKISIYVIKLFHRLAVYSSVPHPHQHVTHLDSI